MVRGLSNKQENLQMSEFKSIHVTVDEKMILAALQCDHLDEDHVRDMRSKVTAAAEQAPSLPVVLDMSQVAFVPSLSLGALVSLLGMCKKNNQRLILVGLQTAVRQVLTMCRLDRLFETYDTLDDFRARLSV
jgi:anti-anti-sigma factor